MAIGNSATTTSSLLTPPTGGSSGGVVANLTQPTITGTPIGNTGTSNTGQLGLSQPANQPTQPTTPTPKTTGTPMNDVLTNIQSQTPTPNPAQGFSFLNGGSYDASGNYIPPNSGAIDTQLNSAQDNAFGSLGSAKDTDTLVAKANSMIEQAYTGQQTEQNNMTSAQQQAANIPNLVQQNYYTAMNQTGLTDAQQQVLDATQEYGNAQLAEASNPIDVRNQYAGQSSGFGNSLISTRGQQLSIDKLAAGIKLQVAQTNLNNKTDMFKTLDSALNSGDQFAVQKQIDLISQRTGVDNADLSAGVNLLNQVRQENQNNETQTRQWMQMFATQFPNFYSQLTPSDQQAISNGQITPSILSLMGKVATAAGSKLGIQQQQANTQTGVAVSNEISNLVKNAQVMGIDISSPQFQGLVDSMMDNLGTTQDQTNQGGQDNSLVSSNPNPQAVVNGYDLTSYTPSNATSTPTEAINVSNTVQKLGGIGAITDPQTATSAIQSIIPNSPITGDMVMAASQATGVDPAMIIGVMNADSSLGTKGLAVNSMNPGNVGTFGGNVQKYNSWDDGVMAVAQNLAKRQVGGQQLGQTGSQQGQTDLGWQNGQQVPVDTNSIYYQDVKTSSSGAKYLDSSQYKTDYRAAQTYARDNGIFFATKDQATALDNVETARNYMQQMSDLAPNVLYDNALGKIGGLGGLSKMIVGKTGLGGGAGNLAQWDSLNQDAAKAFEAISGMNRIYGGQWSTTIADLPKSNDTIQQGMAKISGILNSLNSAEKAVLGSKAPNYTTNSPWGLQAQSLGGISLQGNQ